MTRPQRKPATPEEVWEILREVSENQKETDRQMKETDRMIKENQKETDRQMKETDLKFQETAEQMKETDRIIKESAEETDQKFKETAEQMKGTDRRLKALDKLYNGQWGKLMESLVEGDLVKMLKERGIDVRQTSRNLKNEGGERNWEFDLLAVNGDEVVVVEVKTMLKVKDVDHFLNKLGDFKELVSYHKDKKVYGAVAYLKADQSSNIYAEKQGLFVIRATGSSAKIVNDEGFKAKKF